MAVRYLRATPYMFLKKGFYGDTLPMSYAVRVFKEEFLWRYATHELRRTCFKGSKVPTVVRYQNAYVLRKFLRIRRRPTPPATPYFVIYIGKKSAEYGYSGPPPETRNAVKRTKREERRILRTLRQEWKQKEGSAIFCEQFTWHEREITRARLRSTPYERAVHSYECRTK